MNKNITFLIFAVAGILVGFFLGRESTDSPNLIDESSRSLVDLTETIAQNQKTIDELMADLDRAQSSLKNARKVQNEVDVLRIQLATNSKDSPKPMSAEEIMDALTRAMNDPNPISRSAVFANLLANLNEDNLESVLDVYADMPMGFENMHEYRLLMFAWGKFDAPAAIEYANSRATGMRGRFVSIGAMEGWASQDHQAAIQWIKDQDDPRATAIYNFGVVRGWASRDVAGAADYVTNLELENGWEKGRLVGMLASQFLKEGFPTARQWAETLDDADVKASAFRNLSRQQARENPDQVAAWLKEHAGQKYSEGSFDELGENWGRRDPTAAIEYFEALPEGEGRRQGMLEVVEQWSRKDSEAVGNWLNEKSQSDEPFPEKDEAIGEFAREIAREDAAGAMEWATAIEDNELKERTVTRVGQSWMRQDEEAAKAWLPTSGLTEEVQKAIVTPPDEGRRWSGGPPRGGR